MCKVAIFNTGAVKPVTDDELRHYAPGVRNRIRELGIVVRTLLDEVRALKGELNEMERAWQVAYAGRACPQCGKWVTMNNEEAAMPQVQKREEGS